MYDLHTRIKVYTVYAFSTNVIPIELLNPIKLALATCKRSGACY